MGLSREPYGCVRLHDSACLLISENILQKPRCALSSVEVYSASFKCLLYQGDSERSGKDEVLNERGRVKGRGNSHPYFLTSSSHMLYRLAIVVGASSYDPG